ncbi:MULTISPECIES: UDP-3-O-(3-hydroxymyristoyl)glucosamine N-acyltransferase [Legionella]|uniref:UDP-3-O-acylglucosamine N-acyltransferase n=1 Tax=Legionella septentrionalis TaxID=2498109 RepID=A0A3S0X1Y7_9GAMM|nr:MULTISPECIES: UDP-3-O-(3-hydroxymyristoyl)glucosamine N-acyltransferase [Legionella]MCP0914755.1 UDP-3-O-(3-hydroxymyristoyl)glucosamine N-acyltransferase [Legionella sp. 27cVA30]RUQ91102.1 UDP-3-O-(3-hydroxymyristoyl)glucosamine N-acyltransferase [Legionella septentrionalis]RUR02829.1 UDP-3-O-(3-hydroxymyristoyl)glucosamine N-acyltransferase [Legionella septentrionalis]RUR11427.1 UDP-3-O-(3-hydroxymyristoyl)glucosamine N-acyltransferase [Legionella septentrionalis]RUR15098.1 UDP-3-O-(3-hyd
MNASLVEIAALVQGVVVGGNERLKISTLSPIDNISVNSLVFAEGDDNIKQAEASDAAAILVAKHVNGLNKPIIQVSEPFKAFITLIQHFYPEQKPASGVHPTAVIASDVVLGKNVAIGPYVIVEAGSKVGDNCVIKSHVHLGHGVTIGANTTIHPHVTVYDNCQIGQRVNIHASSVIGSDGFGYTVDDGKHLKVPHVGCVVIEDDVEIGANTVIDRATLGATVIGEGTKIDNLVQVAHSVKLGKHNILCAFTGIAGSTTSGNHVIFAANVGVSDHVRIDDGVILGARAGVPPKKHLKQGNIYLGNPARPKDKAIEQELATTRIPIMRKNLKTLSEKVDELALRLKQQETQQ